MDTGPPDQGIEIDAYFPIWSSAAVLEHVCCDVGGKEPVLWIGTYGVVAWYEEWDSFEPGGVHHLLANGIGTNEDIRCVSLVGRGSVTSTTPLQLADGE